MGPQRQQPLPSINRNEESNGLDDSAEMGQRVKYRELRRLNSFNEAANLKRNFLTDLFFDAMIMMLVVHFGSSANCGIPIFSWCIIYFLFIALRSLSNFYKSYLARNFVS